MLQSRFRCRLLFLSTLCPPPLESDVFGYCLLALRVTIDVLVSESVDQEFASMCLQQHRKKKLAEILWESPPGVDVLLTARHHLAKSRTSLASVSVLLWLLESRWILAKLRPQWALRMLVFASESSPEASAVVTTV